MITVPGRLSQNRSVLQTLPWLRVHGRGDSTVSSTSIPVTYPAPWVPTSSTSMPPAPQPISMTLLPVRSMPSSSRATSAGPPGDSQPSPQTRSARRSSDRGRVRRVVGVHGRISHQFGCWPVLRHGNGMGLAESESPAEQGTAGDHTRDIWQIGQG